ncbi:MAG: hypothetical protein ACHQ2E_04695 [Gemmatimonadales bacterium]
MTFQWWCAGIAGVDAMASFMRAMLGGMLILVVPAFFVCAGITRMAYLRRNKFIGE